MAEQLSQLLMEEFDISGIRMKVSKPGAVKEATLQFGLNEDNGNGNRVSSVGSNFNREKNIKGGLKSLEQRLGKLLFLQSMKVSLWF